MCLRNTHRRTNHEEPSNGAKLCAFIYLVRYFQRSSHRIDLGAGGMWQAIDLDCVGTRELSQSCKEDDAILRLGRRAKGLPKTDCGRTKARGATGDYEKSRPCPTRACR